MPGPRGGRQCCDVGLGRPAVTTSCDVDVGRADGTPGHTDIACLHRREVSIVPEKSPLPRLEVVGRAHAAPSAVVLVLHGGRAHSRESGERKRLTYRRMIPFAHDLARRRPARPARPDLPQARPRARDAAARRRLRVGLVADPRRAALRRDGRRRHAVVGAARVRPGAGGGAGPVGPHRDPAAGLPGRRRGREPRPTLRRDRLDRDGRARRAGGSTRCRTGRPRRSG